MYQFRNKVTGLTFSENGSSQEPQKVTYFVLIASCLKNLGRGATYGELRRRRDLIRILEKGDEVVSFQDTDWAYAKKCVLGNVWGQYSEELVSFLEQVDALQPVTEMPERVTEEQLPSPGKAK